MHKRADQITPDMFDPDKLGRVPEKAFKPAVIVPEKPTKTEPQQANIEIPEGCWLAPDGKTIIHPPDDAWKSIGH